MAISAATTMQHPTPSAAAPASGAAVPYVGRHRKPDHQQRPPLLASARSLVVQVFRDA